MCIVNSFNKIHYIFPTNQDNPEFKKNLFGFNLSKIHFIIFYQFENFDMECFHSEIYPNSF